MRRSVAGNTRNMSTKVLGKAFKYADNLRFPTPDLSFNCFVGVFI